MAESILFNVAADIIIKLGSSAVRKFGLAWDVNDELEKLTNSVSAIQALLLDAEEQQFQSRAVKDWVSRLKLVLCDIDDLMDEFSYETIKIQVMTRDGRSVQKVSNIFSKSIQFSFRRKVRQNIEEISERLKAIHDERNQFSFSSQPVVIVTTERYDDWSSRRRETSSYILEQEVIGRNNDKEAIIDLPLNTNTTEHITVISIVGMGGIGKTALAQSIYNHNRTTNQFQLKLWVCVSEEFDLKIILQKIIESAIGKKPGSFLQIDSLQSELRKQIDGKKYLLVMDDVWNEEKEEWSRLKKLLMGGAKGSRILITTRSIPAARTFDTTFFHYLKFLDACNSWLLFQKMTGLEGRPDNQEKLDQNSNLIQIGKEIVSRLKGFPLIIRTVGGLLKDNKSERFWLFFKDKKLYQVLGQEHDHNRNEILSILELSYKYLPANLKKCFLYCALFPKNYEIQKDELILLWRAQDFIQPNSNDNFIDIGEKYFLELLSRSFFQEVTTNYMGDIKACKMHDLMHDLACWIRNNECMHGWIEKDMDKRINHFSWEEYYCEEFVEKLFKTRKLRTLIWRYDPAFSSYGRDYNDKKVLSEKIFHNLLRLRTLELDLRKASAILVKSIHKLKHLR